MVLRMITEFMGDTIAAMREYAGLSVDDLATSIGIGVRTLQRIEANDRKTVVKHDVLEKIVDATGVTKRIFAEILATTAGPRLDVRLAVMPPDALVPSSEATKVFRLFADHSYKLSEQERESIEDLLDNLRGHTIQADRTSKAFARDITRRINAVRKERGEDLSDDSGS